MSTAANCCVRGLRRLGKRQIGVSLQDEWVEDAGAVRGEAIGVDLVEGVHSERAVVLRLSDYDEAAVGWEVVLGDRDGTPVVTLPEGVRDLLGIELEERLLLERSRDDSSVRVEVP
jgi:hypothetical protein